MKRHRPTDVEPSPTNVKPSPVIVEPSRRRHSPALQAWSLVLRLHCPALLAKPPSPPSQNYEAQTRENLEKALEPHEHQKAKNSPCFDRFPGDFLRASKFGFSGALQGQSPALRARSPALQVKSPDSNVRGPALRVRNAAPKYGALPYKKLGFKLSALFPRSLTKERKRNEVRLRSFGSKLARPNLDKS